MHPCKLLHGIDFSKIRNPSVSMSQQFTKVRKRNSSVGTSVCANTGALSALVVRWDGNLTRPGRHRA